MALNDDENYAIYIEGYVGYSPLLGTVIVAHQGTNTKEMLVLILEQLSMKKLNMCIEKPISQTLTWFWNR